MFKRNNRSAPLPTQNLPLQQPTTRSSIITRQPTSNWKSYWALSITVFSIAVTFYTSKSFLSSLASLESDYNPEKSQRRRSPKAAALIRNKKRAAAFQPKSSKECNKFDHGDTSPTLNVTSVFNCNSPSGTCKWFYPSKFFNEYCGVGKEWSNQINYMEEHRLKGDLWLSGPPIVLPWVSLHPGIQLNKKHQRKKPFVRHNLSMVHVHKTGGTSLVTAFSSLAGQKAKSKRRTVYMPPKAKSFNKNNFKNTTKKGKQRAKITSSNPNRGRNESGTFLDGVVKYKHEDEWKKDEHTLFAVIRDPAERFISAIGQATGAFGSGTNNIGPTLLKECGQSTGKETLRCFVDLMMHNGTWIEVHFTPMALEISFATMYKDIPVAVFPFKEVPTLMYELNQDPNEKKKDGKKKGFRKSEVLTNLSMDDYDDSILRDLCQVYKVDVLFLQHIGYDSSCDRFIAKQNRLRH